MKTVLAAILLSAWCCITTQAAARDLSVATSTYCPLICDSRAGQPGLLQEVLVAVFNTADYDVSFQNMPYERAIRSTIDGRYDITPFAGEANSKDFLFVRNLKVTNEVRFATLNDSQWAYSGVDSLRDIRIGIPNGFMTGNRDVDEYLSKAADTKVFRPAGESPSVSQIKNLRLLVEGRIDAMLIGSLAFSYIARQEGLETQVRLDASVIANFVNHVAVSPAVDDAEALRAFIERRLDALRETGQLERLFSKYGLMLEE